MSDHNQVKITSMDFNKKKPKAENPLKIQDLTFRDGHQSLFATRGRTEDMIPIAEMMDNVGFWALETWGGATFDAMHRFLNEDPWERIRTLKKYIKKTRFSMLLRGQNLVGYRNYADDVARAFVERAAHNGIDIFRTFDALNDYRNFETVVPVIKECGKHFQGCICYSLTEKKMGGEVYHLEYYVKKAKELEAMEANSICIKDMAGLMAPYDAYVLVKALKGAVSVPVHLHSHFTSGMSSMTHLKAIEAGVDIVGTCMSPYGFRTSHPALGPLVMTLMGTNRDTGFDIKQLAVINEIIEKDIIPKYRYLMDDTKVSIIDINVLVHQVPGGMLSNLKNQLKEMNALDKLDKVYAEIPKVRKALGQVPLVTPMSQIVGTQAINNILFDDEKEHYKMITTQVKDLCYGLYGKTPVSIDSKVMEKALKNYRRGKKPITCRAAEIIEPELDKAKEDVKDLAVDLEDVLIYALYPVTGKRFLKWKYGREEPPAEVRPRTMEDIKAEQELVAKAKAGKLVEKKEKIYPEKNENLRTFNVFVDDEYFEVGVEEVGGLPMVSYIPQAQSQIPVQQPAAIAPSAHVIPAVPQIHASLPVHTTSEKSTNTAPQKTKSNVDDTLLKAPMPGIIISYKKQEGDSVNPGETVVILEAMKMENALPAPAGGIIKSINFASGDSVSRNDVLCVIG